MRLARASGLRVLDGVGVKDRLVLNPPDSMADGDQVAIAPAAADAAKK